jgi:hypothetical protein
MSEEGNLLAAKLEIVSNNTPERPYHVIFKYGQQRTVEADFNLDLRELKNFFDQSSPEEYGKYLYECVFEESVNSQQKTKGEVGLRLREVIHQAEDAAGTLRLELEIKNNLPGLHAVSWEYMFDSNFGETGLAFAADHRLALFRNLEVNAPQRKPISGIPRVLIAIINPSEASLARLNSDYSTTLAPISFSEEKNRLETLFKSIRVQMNEANSALLYQILPPEKSSLDQICSALDDGDFHVLHIICHGLIIDDKSFLVLVNEDGEAIPVSAEAFAKKFANKTNLRLILLGACQSARQSCSSAFSGVTSQLINYVPAAIGMQRVWFTETAGDKFIDRFYKELCKHGSVDIALQRARQDLRCWKPERWEWGTPVLYLHLDNGLLFCPEKKVQRERRVTRSKGRKGGTGLFIGGGAKLKNVVIDADAAGGDIFDGVAPPLGNRNSEGVGIQIKNRSMEDVVIKGKYAGGSIYKQALDKQALESFAPDYQVQVVRDKIEYYRRRLQEVNDSIYNDEKANPAKAHEELVDIRAEVDQLLNLLSSAHYGVLIALSSSVALFDKMCDQIADLIENREASLSPREHDLKIERIGSELVARSKYGSVQKITGTQLMSLPYSIRKHVMVLEQSMQNHYEMWANLYPKRDTSPDLAINAEVDKQLLSLVLAMKSDLLEILEFLRSNRIELYDHYQHIRDLINRLP